MKGRDFQTLVLCGFVHNRGSFAKFASDVGEDCFTEPDLKAVFEAMLQIGPKFTTPDIASDVEVQRFGGVPLIRDIALAYKRYGLEKSDLDLGTVKKFASATEKIGRIHHIRSLLKAGLENVQSSEDKWLKIKDEEIVAEIISGLVKSQSSKGMLGGFKPYADYLAQFKTRLDKIRSGEIDFRLTTPFKSFNRSTTGLPVPGLVILAGVPSSGKTQLAWQFILGVAENMLKERQIGVCAVNSVEMLGLDLASRAVLSSVGVDSNLLRRGDYADDENVWRAIDRERERQSKLPIMIDESDYLTSKIISSRVSGLKSQFKNVVLVMTDYAELVSDKGESAEQRMASVFINAKALAKRLNCTVVLLSQLNRQVELSGTRVPSMRHLRYSGMAEQAADMIILIYNPNNYVRDGIKITPHPQMPPAENTAYIIVGKHREGPTGFLPMGWIPTFSRWSDLGSKTKLVTYSEGSG